MSEAPNSEVFMARVEALLQQESATMSPLAAAIVVAVDMGIADSRSFARVFGVEHALVLREVADLSGADGFLTVKARQPKTLRTALGLSARGELLLARA